MRNQVKYFGMMATHATPVIGAINGPTVTGGLELALSCDFLIASERARFADTHARVGVMPGGGLTIRLPQLIGLDRARRMSFTGDFIDAETARDWGLVVEVAAPRLPVGSGAGARRHRRGDPIGVHPRDQARLRRDGGPGRPGGLARRVTMVEAVARRALRPVASRRRAREDRCPRSGAEYGARRHAGVKVYSGMDPRLRLRDAIGHAQRVERLGYDGLHVAETVHDALAVALLVAEHTERITVRTSVALAFTRSPTLLAYAAWDISHLSGGRFELGLGTQIRQNIEDRYAVPFGEDPIGRLGDYVGAVRAGLRVVRHWRGTRLREHALPPHPPAALLQPRTRRGGGGAADLPRGRAAASLRAGRGRGRRLRESPHQFQPALPARDLPARAGCRERAAGRDLARSSFEVVIGTPVVTGASPEAVAVERERQRRLLAFLYSTPAYARRWSSTAGRTSGRACAS